MDKAELENQITQAIRAHGEWKLKLGSAVRTGVLPKPARDIACDDQCGFGKWLYRIKADPEIARSTGFQNVLSTHAAFHREAGRIAGLVEQGEKEAAQRALDAGDFKLLSANLANNMGVWKASV